MDTSRAVLTRYETEAHGYTPGALHGLLVIRALDDDDLLDIARELDEGPGSALSDVLAQMGPSTNHYWITAEAAATAYQRGLIDQYELDGILL